MKFIIAKFCWQCSWVISHCLLPVSVWPAVLGHWTSVPKRPNSVDFFVIPELKSPSLSLILPCFQVSEPTQYIITITKRVYASMIINWPAIQKLDFYIKCERKTHILYLHSEQGTLHYRGPIFGFLHTCLWNLTLSPNENTQVREYLMLEHCGLSIAIWNSPSPSLFLLT